MAPVPVLAGGVAEDGLGVRAWPHCVPTNCTELDFRKWVAAEFPDMAEEVESLVEAYNDEVAIENYTKWYWAMQHAGADQWSGCYARRVASWVTRAGQEAYYYRWS